MFCISTLRYRSKTFARKQATNNAKAGAGMRTVLHVTILHMHLIPRHKLSASCLKGLSTMNCWRNSLSLRPIVFQDFIPSTPVHAWGLHSFNLKPAESDPSSR